MRGGPGTGRSDRAVGTVSRPLAPQQLPREGQATRPHRPFSEALIGVACSFRVTGLLPKDEGRAQTPVDQSSKDLFQAVYPLPHSSGRLLFL